MRPRAPAPTGEADDDWWTRVSRVLAGEASARERDALRRENGGDPEVRARLDAARDAWNTADAAPSDWNVERALATVLARRRRPSSSQAPIARRYRSRFRLAKAAAAAVVVAAAVWALRSAPTGEARRYVAAPGARAEIQLADGTAAVLGPGSALTVAADFGRRARTVTLSGDGYFDVRHDHRRPFVVHAGPAVIRVTGTKFAIRTCHDATRPCPVTVVVREGSVVVRRALAPTDSIVVTRGLGAEVDGAAPIRVTRADTAALLAWIDNRLVFSREPFGRAVARFGLWYGVTVQVSDTVLAHRLVTASFAHADARAVAAALGLLADAWPTWTGDTVVFLPGLPHSTRPSRR